MRSALIGSTGFVGSNLADARTFDVGYHSSDVHRIAGEEFDVVFSAATRADSHRINGAGDADRAEIDTLIGHLSRARIGHLVLVSTVCVYPGGSEPDEDTPLSEHGLTPYGANRLHMERRLQELFDTTVVRLPQLYGARLKKGVVHDLLRDHRVEYIAPDDRLQHYDVRLLADHVDVARNAGVSSLNLATASVSNATLADVVFDRDISGSVPPAPPSPYARMYSREMRSRHAALFGGADGLLQDEATELAAIADFVATTGDDRA